MHMRTSFFTTTAILLIACAPGNAADAPANFEERFVGTQPAVSAINGKIEASYNYVDIDGLGDDDAGSVAGAISFPVGERFGIQVDGGLAGGGDVGTSYGVGIHAFWRDPSVALLGFYGDVVRADTDFGPDITNYRFGAEGELYLDRVSVEAFVGGDHTDAGDFEETYFSAEALAAFYVTEDIRLHAGIGHRFDDTFGRVGAEALLPFASRNVAVFGDGTFGDDVTTARVGLRVYFGEPGKSLIDRHRQDDPRIRLFDVFGGGVEGFDGYTPPSCGEGCT